MRDDAMPDRDRLAPVAVRLPADIDITNSAAVGGELRAALAPGVRLVIADMTETVFRDLSGLRHCWPNGSRRHGSSRRQALANMVLPLLLSPPNWGSNALYIWERRTAADSGPNVFLMEQLGATVITVTQGSRVLKDAVNAALRDWLANSERYVLPARFRSWSASLSIHGPLLSERGWARDPATNHGPSWTIARLCCRLCGR